MAENMIKFLRGNVANLPQTATAGAVYFTKDEGLYLGLEDGSYHRYGDFITVADVASLPESGAHETCMYYCESENILAKWDGSTWVQINKQKTLAELGGVAKSVYDTKMAALEKADTDNATAISGVDTRLQAAEEKLKSVATTEGLGELTDRVGAAEGEIDALQAAIGVDGSVTLAIADAKKAGTDAADAAATAQAAAEAAQATADSKTTMAAVEEKGYQTAAQVQAIADGKDEAIAAAKKAGDDAQDAVDALAAKVGTVPADKTVVQMISDAQTAATYDDTKVKEDIKANADAIDDIEADYLKAADKTELSDAITAEKDRAEGIESGLRTDVDVIKGDYLKTADKTALQEQITANAGAIELLTNGVSAEEVDGVNDLIQYVKDHGTEVTGMKDDIAANAKAISDQATSDAATYETKTDASGKLTEAKNYADGLNTAMDTRVKVLEAIDHDAYVDADTEVLADAKEYADGLNTAMNTRVEALEAIDHEHANKAELDLIVSGDKAKWDEAAGKAHTHTFNETELNKIVEGDVAKWNAAQANAEATAAGALASAKTELEGKITAAETAAKGYTDTEVKELADGAVATNTADITVLKGTGEGSVAKALADAKAYADTAESDAITTANAYTDSALTWGSF